MNLFADAITTEFGAFQTMVKKISQILTSIYVKKLLLQNN